MIEPPLPELRCPLCGEPNACAPARSGSFDTPCWCASVRFDPAALAAAAGKPGCLCAKCAGGGGQRAGSIESPDRG
ncbi:MAG: cysteine-rich CWC family protein [Burkholderiales bacterium]